MSILSIFFACMSSLSLFGIAYVLKELSKTHDWAFGVGIPILIAATLLFNYIKDKISERDPGSKLYKVSTELNELKSQQEYNLKKLKTEHAKDLNEIKKKHDTTVAQLNAEIHKLQKTLSIKDTMLVGIKGGISNNIMKHVNTPELFFDYAKRLMTQLNSDVDMNTTAPIINESTQKYLAMLKAD